jgi:hypothetical protein
MPCILIHNVTFIISVSDVTRGKRRRSGLKNANISQKTRSTGTTRKHHVQDYLKADVDRLRKQFSLPADIVTDCPLHTKLRQYHDEQETTLLSVATPKITPEIAEVVEDVRFIDIDERPHQWSDEDKARLNSLTAQAKLLRTPPWPWGASDDSEQGRFNHARLRLWADKQCCTKLLTCPECGVTVLLVGIEQQNYEMCPDCVAAGRLKSSSKKELKDTWSRVRPKAQRPKCVTPGYEDADLPELMPGDKAVIALIHPVVTVRRNQQGVSELKEECIHLLQNPKNAWAKFLPRVNLTDRYVILERKNESRPSRYIITDTVRVRLWLDFLFQNHRHYVEYQRLNVLNYNPAGLCLFVCMAS